MQKPEELNLLRDRWYAKSNSPIDIRQHMLPVINIYYLIKNLWGLQYLIFSVSLDRKSRVFMLGMHIRSKIIKPLLGKVLVFVCDNRAN